MNRKFLLLAGVSALALAACGERDVVVEEQPVAEETTTVVVPQPTETTVVAPE